MAKRILPPMGALSPDKDEQDAAKILASAQVMVDWPSVADAYKDAKPCVHESLVAKYHLFANKIYIPDSVLYPSCELDISPIAGFPSSKVTLLDKDPRPVEALRRNGIDCLCMDINDYRPERLHDLLILLNPVFHTEEAAHTVAQGGYIMANNYFPNAQEMFDSPRTYRYITTIENKGKTDQRSFAFVNKKRSLVLLANSADHTWIFQKK